MHFLSKTASLSLLLLASHRGMAGTTQQTLIFEVDPFKPIAAANEEKSHDCVSFSNWSGRADFNIQNLFSTGPEFWVGNYARRGLERVNDQPRREDLWLGEKQKLSATRFRWNFTIWEVPQSMRGWSITAGYDYLRIDSKANRYTDGPAGTLPVGPPIDAPQDENDLVTDTRLLYGAARYR